MTYPPMPATPPAIKSPALQKAAAACYPNVMQTYQTLADGSMTVWCRPPIRARGLLGQLLPYLPAIKVTIPGLVRPTPRPTDNPSERQ